MALNKNDRQQIEKKAQSEGYSWNKDSSKMTNGQGGNMKFSSSGGSVLINKTPYTSGSAAKKSTNW